MKSNLIALFPLIALWSCAAPGVKEFTEPIADSTIAQLLVSGDHLTPELRAYLKEEGLDAAYRQRFASRPISTTRSDGTK